MVNSEKFNSVVKEIIALVRISSISVSTSDIDKEDLSHEMFLGTYFCKVCLEQGRKFIVFPLEQVQILRDPAAHPRSKFWGVPYLPSLPPPRLVLTRYDFISKNLTVQTRKIGSKTGCFLIVIKNDVKFKVNSFSLRFFKRS